MGPQVREGFGLARNRPVLEPALAQSRDGPVMEGENIRMHQEKLLAFVGAFLLAGACTVPAAVADSCWNHNGSLMRLKAEGSSRWLLYENPRSVLRNAGVHRGTLLFNGVKNGNWYSGTARVYSKYCPGEPLEYFVEGPVSANQLRITVRGTRQIFSNCQPTGNVKSDKLVFTYSHKC